jgi:hypothetical protein
MCQYQMSSPTQFPYDSSTAAAVSSRGDLIVRDLVTRSNYQVVNKETSGDSTATTAFYVYDAALGETIEATSIKHVLDEAGSQGSVKIGVLHTGSTQTIETALDISAASTTISSVTSSAALSATFGTSGLSFDSDTGAIYFGASQDFRIQYTAAAGLQPSKLEIQAFDSGSSSYVTRFFIAGPAS